MKTPVSDARAAAYESLMRIEKGGYSNITVDTGIRAAKLSGDDKALYTALVYGVTERRLSLDWMIFELGSRRADELDRDVLTVLRLGLYQLKFMDRIPDHAAVYETVELGKKVCERPRAVSGYINAVMRSALRNDLQLPDLNDNRVYALSVRYSLPEELVSLWLKDYPEHALRLMEYADSDPPMTLRVNTLSLPVGVFAEQLKSAKINSVPFPDDAPYALTVNVPYSRLKKFDRQFYVQDRASQLAMEAFDAQPGERILDTCSAPGGKAFYCAMKMNNSGSITACDLHGNKLKHISDGAERLGIKIITALEHDAKEYDASLGEFDKVLCDVPCSGLGAIAKKPEIRYKDMSEISRLPETQYAILETSCRYVRAGGTLMYSTCTLNRAENDEVAARFTSEHEEFVLKDEKTLLPDVHGCDGFYYSIWQRKA